uniref:NADH-ubiquinone oxidoreductase chain 2 n=1 Tax=Eurytemora affinis TaxID=88015 RepID=A0A6G7NYN7_EURAF|nr:NADH dehydrogenase subunit 2 [Eurytemora affinis]QIJ60005.1 NADH dehydrogenase subunit 2 [Eurytemora affinis]
MLTPLLGYLALLGVCILGSLSVNSMLGQWVCLEVNMLCIIPVLVYSMTEDSILTGVKYFISQSAASLMFVLGLFLSMKMSVAMIFMTLSIFFKLGLPPMQSWLTSMLPSMSWMSMWLIFTVQKIIPLTILSFLKLNPFVFGLTLFGGLFFILGSLSQVSSLFMLMFLSSVANGMWALSVVGVSGNWGMFMGAYSLLLLSVMMSFSALKISSVGSFANVGLSAGLMLSLQFLNLGGLPPLLGFLIKLMMMKQLVSVSFLVLSALILSSLGVLFVYVSVTHQSYCFNSALKISNGGQWVSMLSYFTLAVSGLGIWFLI